MKEYRVVGEFENEQNMENLERNINRAADQGFRPILISTSGQGLVTVLMERERSETKNEKER